jgi:DNA modification methylase
VKVIDQVVAEDYAIYNADCVDIVATIPDNSIGCSIYSPPFASLYAYSNYDRDMGNATSDEQFYAQFGFLANEMYRVMMPGRVMAVHCMNIPAMKERDGYIGLKDFRGDLIRLFLRAGFIFHSETCIWKDPLTEATRTKALGLMHKQLQKDSSMCRAGIPDYLLGFRKPGVNPKPIAHPNGLDNWYGEDPPTNGNLSHERWRRYASPVWDDINQGRTLNYREARGESDTRHICALQLDVIERALDLWSAEGDTVLSPFMGIGSEGWCSVKANRKFIGAELKPEYFQCAAKNLADAVTSRVKMQIGLFDMVTE